LAVYFTDEDALFDDATPVTPVAPVVPVPPVPVAPVDPINISPFKTYAVTNTFKSPYSDGYDNENFPVMSRKEATDRLNDDLKDASLDLRYNSRALYRGRDDYMWGKLGTAGLTNDTIKMMAVINTELNYFADFFNIPRIRGYKAGAGKAIANQGDGVMAYNPVYFNKWAEDMRNPVDEASVDKKLTLIENEQKVIDKELDDFNAQQIKLREQRTDGTWTYGDDAWIKEFEEIETEIFKRLRRQKELRSQGRTLMLNETYDDYKAGGQKPFTSEKYFKGGIDHMRATMYHEFGHHIHQYKNSIIENNRLYKKPTEEKLNKFFLKNFKLKKNRALRLSTRYAETNSKEYFAEQFALYALNKRGDFVTPEFFEFMEDVFSDKKFR
jgi:hypothetical protein